MYQEEHYTKSGYDSKDINHLEALKNLTLLEMNTKKEKNYMKEGYEIYHHPEQGIHSVKLAEQIDKKLNKNRRLIAMHYIPGPTLGQTFNAITQGLKKQFFIKNLKNILENLQILWYHELCFGKGTIIYGDLHPGNIKVAPNGTYITLFDYGNCIIIKKKYQYESRSIEPWNLQTVWRNLMEASSKPNNHDEIFKAFTPTIYKMKFPSHSYDEYGKSIDQRLKER